MPIGFFSKTPVPETLPEEMQRVIDGLKKSENKKECLKKVYAILNEKYHGDRLKTYPKIFSIFTRDPNKLWKRNGFLHCTNFDYLARIFLIKSGFFQEEALKLRWTLIWYLSPHQYLQVRIDGEWIDIDIWARVYGIPLGDHAHGFHCRFFKA